jgi:hypothetical protein
VQIMITIGLVGSAPHIREIYNCLCGRVVKVARRLASMHTSETGLGSTPGTGVVNQAVHPFGVG